MTESQLADAHELMPLRAEDILSPEQAAQRLGMPVEFFTPLLSRGVVPYAARFGRQWRIHVKGLDLARIVRALRGHDIRWMLFDDRRDRARDFVYFIQSGANGPIKIGLARDPAERLDNLQVGNPETLSLVATLEGSFAVESFLHALFRRHLIRGEWYRPAPELLTFIRSVAQGGRA